MKIFKKILLSVLIVITTLTISQTTIPQLPNSSVVEAASVKLNKTKYTLVKGSTYKLKISGTKKKVKWSSSNKSVATVNSKGKVTAKKKGTATITAKVGNKKYKCKITVKNHKSNSGKVTSKTVNSSTVYITRTGKKYHRGSCSSLRSSKIQTTIKSARSQGYTACKRCNP